jgi:hypothetical protein
VRLASHPYQIGSGVSTPKRKRSFSDEARERKMQKISLSLANDIARSLSVADGLSDSKVAKRRTSAMVDDTEMFFDDDTNTKDVTSSNTPKKSSFIHPRNHLGLVHQAETPAPPVMRSITELLSTQSLLVHSDTMQMEHWMMSQALSRGMTLPQFEMELRLKEQQLQTALLGLSQSHDLRVGRGKEYAHMKTHLEAISMVIKWIEHDHQWPIEVCRRYSACPFFFFIQLTCILRKFLLYSNFSVDGSISRVMLRKWLRMSM